MPLCPSPCLRFRLASAVLLWLVLGLSFGGIRPQQAVAQSAVQALVSRSEADWPEEEAELRRTLERHAEVLEAQAAVIKTVARLIGPAVVHVEADVPARAVGMYNRRRQIEEAGSGVIIRFDGKYYVLTNGHVIRDSSPEQIRITLADGRQIHPDEFRDDPESDVAVMAVSAPDLVTARLGDSDTMEIGDFVLAVGSPFGLSQSVTFGILSAKDRRSLPLGGASLRFQDFFQTDAAVNPGNSGGPLVNLRGEVIAINTAIASNSGGSEGIAFAIPINMFMKIGRQLIEEGTVRRAFLGVDLDQQFGPAMAAEIGLPRPIGARITGVRPGTPAEEIDLHVGDVILEFNKISVEDDAHLMNVVSLTEVGKTVSLVIFRNREPVTLTVTVGDRSKLEP